MWAFPTLRRRARRLTGDRQRGGRAPSERIAAYVAALLERWCDITEDEEDTSPWSTGPLIGEASGPLVYFPMRWSMAEEASAYAAAVAESMGLVCFDVQQDRLRP